MWAKTSSAGYASRARSIIVDGIENDDWVVIAAAGNTGGNTELGAASADASVYAGHVLAVGSVDVNNQLSDFSASATTSDTFEDSGEIPGVVEHVIVAPGSSVCVARTTLKPQGRCAGVIGNSTPDSCGTMSGTSCSTPLGSGAVAVIRSAYPSLNGKQIVDILLDSAKDLGTPGFDSTYGVGLLDVGAALQLAGQRADAAP